jgi:hypothetical protein
MFNNHLTKFKEKKHLDTVLKVLSFLCAFYVLDNLYSAITENINDKVELSNILNFFVKVFQNIVFGLLLTNLFLKFKYRHIGFIMPLAYMEQSDNFLSSQLHYSLLNSGFYNFFSDNPGMISPEYPRVIIFLFILILSFGLLFTKWRDFKKTFLTLGAGGVFITALIFHTVIIREISAFKEHDSKIMENIAFTSQSSDDVSKACIINEYDCFFVTKKQEESLFDASSSIPESIKIQLPYLKPYFLEDKEFFWYGISHEPKAMNRIIGQTPFALAKQSNFSVIIKNRSSYKNFLVVNQYVFVWLALASHFTWFFGSLFLIHFHEKRFRKKASKVDSV